MERNFFLLLLAISELPQLLRLKEDVESCTVVTKKLIKKVSKSDDDDDDDDDESSESDGDEDDGEYDLDDDFIASEGEVRDADGSPTNNVVTAVAALLTPEKRGRPP